MLVDITLRRNIILFFIYCCSNQIAAQHHVILGSNYYDAFDSQINNKNSQIHTASKPLLNRDLKGVTPDSNWSNNYFLSKFLKGKNNNKSTCFLIDPLFHFSTGINNFQSKIETGLGTQIELNIKEKLFVQTQMITYNSSFFDYEQQFINRNDIINGLGEAKPTGLGHHYKYFSGKVAYVADSIFDFQIAHDKNFIGDGHRSLLLSDYASPYTFLKVNTKIWRFKLTNIYANFKDFQGSKSSYWAHPNKYGSIHYLDFRVSKRLTIGFYEAVIWGGKDSSNKRNFDWNYLNPVIFYRPVEYSIGSADNSLIGLNIKYKLSDHIYTYGQLIMDEFLLKEIRERNGWWANKYGYQFGLKYNEVFKISDLDLRIEVNSVRPFTYSHARNLENFGHFNQPLAHPYGSNFQETIAILNWSKKRWNIQYKAVIAEKGENKDTLNFGGDLFATYRDRVSDYGNFIGQGDKVQFVTNQIQMRYLIYPRTNMFLEFGVSIRALKYSTSSSNNLYSWFSIKSAIIKSSNDYW